MVIPIHIRGLFRFPGKEDFTTDWGNGGNPEKENVAGVSSAEYLS